jgi:hypothetical protein
MSALAVALLAVFMGASACGGGDGETDKILGTLELSVAQEGSAPRAATLRCGGPNSSTGYLSEPTPDGTDGTMAACVSALMSEPARDFLEDGKLPRGKACREDADRAPNGATLTARGKWLGETIDRTLTVRNTCTAALWAYLLPLRESAESPLLLTLEELEAR